MTLNFVRVVILHVLIVERITLFFISFIVYQKYKIVNYIMVFCNVNQFKAKKLLKIRGITKSEQVEKTFKSQHT